MVLGKKDKIIEKIELALDVLKTRICGGWLE